LLVSYIQPLDGVHKSSMPAKGWKIACNWSLNGGYLVVCKAFTLL